MKRFFTSVKETFIDLKDSLVDMVDGFVTDSYFQYFNLGMLLVAFVLSLFDEFQPAFYFLLTSYLFVAYRDYRNI